jgi:hypothetical protein
VLQATVIHRHGDRSPITAGVGPESFWSSRLPTAASLAGFDAAFPPLSSAAEGPSPGPHFAAGTPPYGQLSQLGVEQLVSVGRQLRCELGWAAASMGDDATVGSSRLQCFSTPFSRTVQSSQALLTGLLGTTSAAARSAVLQVDTTLGQLLLPDPSPRHPQQLQLEAAHWNSETVRAKDDEMLPLRKQLAARLVDAGVVDDLGRLQVRLLSARPCHLATKTT